MKVLNFIWEYRFIIMLIVWVVTCAITNYGKFKSDLKSGMLAAKQMAKDKILKSGKEQQDWVVKYALEKLPKAWVNFLGEEKVRFLIQKMYAAAMDLIDDGKLNKSI